MKVVLLAPTPPPIGGISGWTVRMMQSNLKNGWHVSVVDERVIGKRQVFGNKSRRNLFLEIVRCHRIWKGLKKELKDPNAKVVHSCIPSNTLSMLREYVCASITKRRKRKFIIHFRCTVPNTTKGRLGRFILKKLCNKSDLIISLNRQTTSYLSTLTKTPIRLIPNFVSADELESSNDIRDHITRAVYVGGVIESKGAHDIVRLAKRLPHIEFRMIGRADDSVERLIEEESVKNVRLLGVMDKQDVREELKAADVFLFLSFYIGEGFSNSLAEAMAAGLPCIVTDWAANADMIGDTGGEVISVGDVDSAFDAMCKMDNSDLRLSQSVTNIKKVEREYVDSVILDEYVNAYESVL